MLRNEASYPYPVIRTITGDFRNTVFNDDITFETTKDGFRLHPHFSINNSDIKKLIDLGRLKYAISVTCKSTLFRKMYFIEKEDTVIEIPAGDVHFQVNYIAYIVACEDINEYYVPDFSEDYQNIMFNIKRGSIIGIGHMKTFRALYDKDLIKDASSIIEVLGSDSVKYMKVELEHPHIQVILPQKQCDAYKNCKGRKNKYPLLSAVVVVPALMEAIDAASKCSDGDDVSMRPWCITLKEQITKISKQMHIDEEQLYESRLTTAQIILGNNSEFALKKIEEME